MPLRLLMYIGRIYEKILGNKNIYSGKRLAVPRPEFIVLYNGTAPFPDEETLKLSDSFEGVDIAGFGRDKPAEPELRVKAYNINQGHNGERLRKSRTLEGYSAFIAKVREYEAAGRGREEAMKAAVGWCTGHDVLRQFFEHHGTEVINMLMTEWNWDDAFAVQRAEGREEGLIEGREENREETARKALTRGLSVDIIREITGLDEETIARLSQN